jgi:protein TonB
MPPPAAVIPTTRQDAPPPPASSPIRAVVRDDAGPVGPAAPAGSGDSQRVGTRANGEPVYAARWYREPTADELRGYLSTASGPGWAIITCRTAPGYRVEDCEFEDEYPAGAQIGRAVMAAAWQFKVRPPQIGGRVLVGEWVRIRIVYGMKRR